MPRWTVCGAGRRWGVSRNERSMRRSAVADLVSGLEKLKEAIRRNDLAYLLPGECEALLQEVKSIAFTCPYCGAGVGERCRTKKGGLTEPHMDRWLQWV